MKCQNKAQCTIQFSWIRQEGDYTRRKKLKIQNTIFFVRGVFLRNLINFARFFVMLGHASNRMYNFEEITNIEQTTGKIVSVFRKIKHVHLGICS